MEILILTVLLLMIQTRIPVSTSNCLGDDTEMCDACGPLGGDTSGTDVRKLQACKAEICGVLCLRSSFSCKFEFKCSGWDGCPAFLEQAKDDRVSDTLFAVQGKDVRKGRIEMLRGRSSVGRGQSVRRLPILDTLWRLVFTIRTWDWKECDASFETTFEIIDSGSR